MHYKLWTKKVIFYGFLVIYFALLIYLCKEITIWEDECYTINTTSHSLTGVISQSYHFEAQPPLYFILLKCWRLLNDSVFFARLLSVLFIACAAYFFTKLVDLISGPHYLRVLLVIFLLNPFTVWAAIEMRSYAMIMFLSTLLFYFFLQFLFNNKNKHLYSFLIISTIGLYTQYLFVFLIMSLLFSFLVFRGWKAFFKLCIYLIPVVLLFLPNLLFISDNIAIQQTDSPDNTWNKTIYLILQTPPHLLLGLNSVPFKGWMKLAIILISIFFALNAYYILYKKNLVSSDPFLEKTNLILITVLVFVFLYVFAFTIFRILYADLYMTIAFPLFILLFTMVKVHSFLYVKLFYASLSLYFIFLLLITYRHPIKFYDFKSIARYVEKKVEYNEPILFYRNVLSLPFKYYFKGSNPLCPLPNSVTFDKNYLVSIKDTANLRQVIGTASDKYILITDDKAGYLYSLNMNRKMINEYLKNNYKTTLDTLYYGRSKDYYLRIRRIERK